ncbi:UDP-N-acetylglucosamine 2-epimerase [Paenibacillus hodogayensis]|uniref:UDP-N-acetylglucosamine 2-epimerase n=1 Tax=Paenibacillus hodogayensis TaxID=279208 RepID=A0ABV5W471_9BACL
MPKRKVCVVTGTRAEYGLLYWVMDEIRRTAELELQLIATGMHLSPEFGLTYRMIEADGWRIDEKVEMLLSGDTPSAVAKSIGLCTIGFADALRRLQPELLVLLGDRYELLAAAQAAMVANIPIAHIAGGDTTEGAIDEAIRHSITKMSHIHFVTNEGSANRVKQMGENPDYVFNVGSPGLDFLQKRPLLGKAELEEALKFRLLERNLLVTFHPATLDGSSASGQFQELLEALNGLGGEVGLLITKPNSDTDGRILIEMIDAFVGDRPNAKSFVSMGQLNYLSAMSHADAVVGNSSSGLYEAPSFRKPTVNIGDRQKGRLQAESVINCPPERGAIAAAISAAWNKDCSRVRNPYGDGDSSARIVNVLRSVDDPKRLLKKRFFEVNGS